MDFIENDDSESATSIQPFQEFWSKNNDFMKSAFENGSTEYYNLLIKPSNIYWLSTRSVNMAENIYSFDMMRIHYGDVTANSMFSNIGLNGDWGSILPIITVNLKSIYGNETNGFIIE